jgi:hypothetical protein
MMMMMVIILHHRLFFLPLDTLPDNLHRRVEIISLAPSDRQQLIMMSQLVMDIQTQIVVEHTIMLTQVGLMTMDTVGVETIMTTMTVITITRTHEVGTVVAEEVGSMFE